MYVGVSSKARNIKAAYVGVNGVARKIKAGYVGVNGVARKIYPSGMTLKSFSAATDAEITAMLTAVRNGTITQQDLVDAGWTVGAERPVHLSAMSATGVGESHVAQDQTWVILHGKDFFNLDDGGKNLFVVGLKNLLANGTTKEGGYMNSTNTNSGGWNGCARRTWCNNVFKNAIPSEELNWFRLFKVKASNGSRSTAVTESTDLFTLPSRAEVFGGSDNSYTPDAEGTTVLSYYSTAANRIKNQGDSGSAFVWWLRSPYVGSSYSTYPFCDVSNDGSRNLANATYNFGLSPFGCF
jgi:hypothetical protein